MDAVGSALLAQLIFRGHKIMEMDVGSNFHFGIWSPSVRAPPLAYALPVLLSTSFLPSHLEHFQPSLNHSGGQWVPPRVVELLWFPLQSHLPPPNVHVKDNRTSFPYDSSNFTSQEIDENHHCNNVIYLFVIGS
ncbi:hypothetical protein D5086_013210 [Populus alba]|uniref:Uncharacterized protein n=1 Tax=Populus alba TaxID=43335 RepID=A0ACC4C585_POPAL